MTGLEENLLLKYKNMVDLSDIITISNNTIFKQNLSILSTLYVSANTTIKNNMTIYSNLKANNVYISNNSTINSQLNLSSGYFTNLTLSSILTSYNKASFNNIMINKQILSTSNVSINSTLSNSNLIIKNNFISNFISNNSIILKGNTINIGSQNSILTINGTVNNILTTNLKIYDKYIDLNYNNLTNNGFDIGNNAGFVIETTYASPALPVGPVGGDDKFPIIFILPIAALPRLVPSGNLIPPNIFADILVFPNTIVSAAAKTFPTHKFAKGSSGEPKSYPPAFIGKPPVEPSK
jgi:hypothetical protein